MDFQAMEYTTPFYASKIVIDNQTDIAKKRGTSSMRPYK